MTPYDLGVITIVTAAVLLVDRAAGCRLHPRLQSGLWLVVLAQLLLPGALVAAVVPDAIRVPLPLRGAAPGGPEAGGGATVLLLRGIWLAGVAVVVARWGWQARQAARRLQPAGPEDRAAIEAVAARAISRVGRRLPAVAIDPAARSPYVTGVVRARLVLPAAWRSWPAAVRLHSLGHELLHLRRRDVWIDGLWTIAAALYWFHPLVHAARRRAHDARELACDVDAAACFGPSYRTTLRVLVGAIALGRPLPAAHHAWGPAVTRLKALDRWSRALSMRRRAWLVVALIGLTAGLVILRPASPARAGAPTMEELVDPAARQARGLGSLHVRYALVGRAAGESR